MSDDTLQVNTLGMNDSKLLLADIWKTFKSIFAKIGKFDFLFMLLYMVLISFSTIISKSILNGLRSYENGFAFAIVFLILYAVIVVLGGWFFAYSSLFARLQYVYHVDKFNERIALWKPTFSWNKKIFLFAICNLLLFTVFVVFVNIMNYVFTIKFIWQFIYYVGVGIILQLSVVAAYLIQFHQYRIWHSISQAFYVFVKNWKLILVFQIVVNVCFIVLAFIAIFFFILLMKKTIALILCGLLILVLFFTLVTPLMMAFHYQLAKFSLSSKTDGCNENL